MQQPTTPKEVLDFAEKYLKDVRVSQATQELSATCPQCGSDGKPRSLSVSIKPASCGVAICNRQASCGFKGNLAGLKKLLGFAPEKQQTNKTYTGAAKQNTAPALRGLPTLNEAPKAPYITPSTTKLDPARGAFAYLLGRGISAEVIEACEVRGIADYLGKGQHGLFFESFDLMGIPVAGHIRPLPPTDKKGNFRAVVGSDSTVPWGLNCLEPACEWLVITEGRLDAMSWKTAGYENAISTNNGFASLSNMVIPKNLLDQVLSIFIAMDSEEEEGQRDKVNNAARAYCFKLREQGFTGNIFVVDYKIVKDANELLQLDSSLFLKIMERAAPFGLSITQSEEANARALMQSNRPDSILSPHASVPDFKRTYLSVIYGGTGMGKSTLAAGIAYDVAQAGTLVGYLSMEMDINTFTNRIFLYATGCGTVNIAKEDYANVTSPMLYNIRANTRRGKLPLGEVVRGLRMQAGMGCELLFVDNFMMIDGPQDVSRYGRIADALTALAIELNVHIVLIAHTAGYRVGCPEFPEGNNMLTRTASGVVATWYNLEEKQHYARCQKNGNELSNVSMFGDMPFYKAKR
jgi:DnaB-like helicase C terminal domain